MARFHPEVETTDIPYDSERLVCDALRALGDDYSVLHSFPWLRPERSMRGTPLREGEADFVVLHPRRGLLIVEVKGGEPVLEGRRWRRGSRPMKDPFEQASRNMHALLDAVEERTQGALLRSDVVHGYAVVFPHCRYEGDLPANAREAIFLDARHLGDLPRHLERAMSAWTSRPRILDAGRFAELRRALLPSLRLVRCVGPSIEQATAAIIQLTEAQQATLSGLFENPRVLVEGVAGSGKTLLALEAAVSRAAAGERVGLLCYNRQLATWLQERAGAEPRLAGRAPSLRIESFHALALRLAREAGVDVPPVHQRDVRFWEEEAALVLDQSIPLLQGTDMDPTLDALVVDEAQDFREDWWYVLTDLLADPRDGPLYGFMDLDQSLWDQAAPPPPELLPVRCPLRVNCRNSVTITESSAAFASTQALPLPGMPTGLPVRHVRARSRDEQRELVEAELARLLTREGLRPDQVALLGPAAQPNGSLAGVDGVGGAPLTTSAERWRHGGGVLCSTARSFKGLEADVVLLYDLSGFGPLFTERDLYVAWTRARHLLLAVSEKGEVRRAIERAIIRGSSA